MYNRPVVEVFLDNANKGRCCLTVQFVVHSVK